jgi:hypothetical protein
MPDLGPPDLAAVRHAYEETDATADAIVATFAIAKDELYRIAKKLRWRRRFPQVFPAGGRRKSQPRPTSVSGPATPKALALHTLPAVPPAVVSGSDPSEPDHARRRAAPSPSSVAARRRLLDRMVAAIALKLEQLERRMTQDLAAIARGDTQTATDHERETRAIGALIDNLGKIMEIESGFAKSAASRAGAAADLAGDAERSRRELAERLGRIVEAAAKRA